MLEVLLKMRSLNRNKRTIYYANFVSAEPVQDEYGNDTLEVTKVYTEPESIKVNISAAVGEAEVEVFGNFTDYSRTITFCNECPIEVGSIVWFHREPPEKHDYVVTKIADSINSYIVALREVT